jgi:anti-sigma factor RsiW
MKKLCKDISEMLVDYADGQLSTEQSSEVAEHLAGCEDCRSILEGLRRSLELVEAIWADGLKEVEGVCITHPGKVRRCWWLRYVAAAVAVMLLVSASIVWYAMDRPVKKEPTFADIEREIIESGSAARLLAAADLLAKYPDAETIAKRQYRYIVKTYPETPAAAKAKLRIE